MVLKIHIATVLMTTKYVFIDKYHHFFSSDYLNLCSCKNKDLRDNKLQPGLSLYLLQHIDTKDSPFSTLEDTPMECITDVLANSN